MLRAVELSSSINKTRMFLPQDAFKPLAEDPQGTALVRAPIWPSVHHRLSDKKYAKMVNKTCHVVY